ncbi:capsid vp91 [Clostera anachoreta granulovirus]|uniref:Capsid vp91 n=1 Tax=Clostera anachoreta granulovirus TaxID=283675 RepID=F4ZKW3_9BBAC|nr:capsid vp91 [Clostera anachoreta granulovirus]AEB00374.1 capsid vp91 [Clostera anachoreta granulovirus]
MISVTSVLFMIFLVTMVLLFYNRFIVDDFNNVSFTTRLNVLKNYMRMVGDDMRVPHSLGYVSKVNGDTYTVTYFDTETMNDVDTQHHDRTVEEFNFVRQSYTPVNVGQLNSSSVSFVAYDPQKFVAHADDGDVIMHCEHGVFDGTQCVPMPVCERADINIPLTETVLNRLLFDRHSAQTKPQSNATKHHPTVYVHCDSDRFPHIEECPNGDTFNGHRCVSNPPIGTNGAGVVTSVKLDKVGGNPYVVYSSKMFGRRRRVTSKNKGITHVVQTDELQSMITDTAHDTRLSMIKTVACSRKILYSKNKAVNEMLVLQPLNLIDNHNELQIKRSTPMVPVNCTYPFDASPCLDNKLGHTFTYETLAPNQFLECLDNNNLLLHTCGSVSFKDGVHVCDVDSDCVDLKNGSGVVVNTIHGDNISFDTGRLTCLNHNIVNVLECDTTDFVSDKMFVHPFDVTFNITLPTQVYDAYTQTCVDYNVDNVSINNDAFKVTVKDMPELSGSMVGRVSKIISQKALLDENMVSRFVTYSRDVGEVVLDPKTCTVTECGESNSGIIVDVLENGRYNLCRDGVLLNEVILKEDEYVDKGEIKRIEGYSGQCRYKDGDDYFDVPIRIIDGYKCEFTVPHSLQ